MGQILDNIFNLIGKDCNVCRFLSKAQVSFVVTEYKCLLTGKNLGSEPTCPGTGIRHSTCPKRRRKQRRFSLSQGPILDCDRIFKAGEVEKVKDLPKGHAEIGAWYKVGRNKYFLWVGKKRGWEEIPTFMEYVDD